MSNLTDRCAKPGCGDFRSWHGDERKVIDHDFVEATEAQPGADETEIQAVVENWMDRLRGTPSFDIACIAREAFAAGRKAGEATMRERCGSAEAVDIAKRHWVELVESDSDQFDYVTLDDACVEAYAAGRARGTEDERKRCAWWVEQIRLSDFDNNWQYACDAVREPIVTGKESK